MNVKITFSPKEQKEEFIQATKEYQEIWDQEGVKIVKALAKWSGLDWKEDKINATVYEGISYSHPLTLRASYPNDIKLATLIHELGHRILSSNHIKIEDDSHKILFLFLYEVWADLYGEEFADKMVTVESNRKGIHDYEGMWNEALNKTQEERSFKLKSYLK